MRSRPLSISLVIIVIAIAALGSAPASAQTKQPSGVAKPPALAGAHDLSGVWMRDRPTDAALQYTTYTFLPDELPMTAWGEAQYKASKPSSGPHSFPLTETNDTVYQGCFPPGVPRIFLHPLPMQIIQVPGEVVMLFESDGKRRQIFTDGRAHDTNLGPSWMGDSIGHWEGDTLIVDTVNFNDRTWIDRMGHPHSDALHLVERIRRLDDHLLNDITVEDPKAYTKPWTAHLDFTLKPAWTLAERFCADDASFMEVEKKQVMHSK